MIIVVGSVFQEDSKYYPQVCLRDCEQAVVNEL